MIKLKEKALRDLGDHGAATLERYMIQIEYTVFWSIRMLHNDEGIEAVIPEGFEDVVIKRRDIYELHQVKTRAESVGAWSFSEILPILCQQYNRRKAFSSDCHFHFVSDQIAENKTQKPISLYRLKFLLDVMHNEDAFELSERKDFELVKQDLIPKIQQILKNKYNDCIDYETAVELLCNTWIETDSSNIRANNNLEELDVALAKSCPGFIPYNVMQLHDIYDRLVLMILRKITKTVDVKERHVYYNDVLSCRSKVINSLENDYDELDQAPGSTILDKKAFLGGFDPTEMPRFHRQRVLSEAIRRKYVSLDMEENLERLVVALLDCQGECRDTVCRLNSIDQGSGPRILAMLRPKLTTIAKTYLPLPEVDNSFCMGLLWRETDQCVAWWSDFKSLA